MLGSRVAVRFVRKARALGRRFGVDLGIEATLCDRGRRAAERGVELEWVVIAAFACDSRRRFDYLLRLLLVQLLTHLAVRLGGRPYGIGIWNAPFVGRAIARTKRRAMAARRAVHDPRGVINPRKFFAFRSRFWNVPGLLFRPWCFSIALWCALVTSPVIGAIARVLRAPAFERWDVPPPNVDDGRALLEEAGQRCTLCGACLSTCPAYRITCDEQTTGRSKLQLAAVLHGGDEGFEVSEEEAFSPFRCLRCGLCEEVCQTGLPLRDCYDVLEGMIVERYGDPERTISDFVARLDADKAWIEETFGLELAEWKPGRRGISDSDGIAVRRSDEVRR